MPGSPKPRHRPPRSGPTPAGSSARRRPRPAAQHGPRRRGNGRGEEDAREAGQCQNQRASDPAEAYRDTDAQALVAAAALPPVTTFPDPWDEAKVYVRNLPYDVSSERLVQLFEQDGVVEVTVLVMRQITSDSEAMQLGTSSYLSGHYVDPYVVATHSDGCQGAYGYWVYPLGDGSTGYLQPDWMAV